MTRVNLVPPEELTDQHLFAEWRELKMIPRSLHRSLVAHSPNQYKANPYDIQNLECGQRKVLSRVPLVFTMNTGHVSFFYDKGRYIQRRYEELTRELSLREFKFDHTAPIDVIGVWYRLPDEFCKDYVPTTIALELIKNRINSRIMAKPTWYRYCGQPLGPDGQIPNVPLKK